MSADPAGALAFFLASSPALSCTPLGRGNVNDTWLVTTAAGERFVLQRLNSAVFADPTLIQDNLLLLTRHLRERLRADTSRFRIPGLITAPDGNASFLDQRGDCWRMLDYIGGSCTISRITTPARARTIGRGLAGFHRLLAGLSPDRLHDPLPGFHHTPSYLERYNRLCGSTLPRAADCQSFIAEHDRDDFIKLLDRQQGRGTLTSQVIHADPKAANFLFSRDGSRVISLIDLDTIRPGLLLHDLGDCFRSCCNPLGEEAEPEQVFFDPRLFEALLSGYCSRAADLLGPGDRELLVDSVRLIAFELGLRFYTDHLQGDRYFKVRSPGHNLFRARVQFGLVRSIEEQYTQLKGICRRTLDAAEP